jgi:hypothetical protein
MNLNAAGHPLHSRALAVGLVHEADGRLALDSYLLDLRKRGFVPVGGDLQGPGIVHHMCVRGAVDPASLRIDRIRAEQPSVAFEANALTRGESCRDPIERITALAGTLLDGDYSTRLSAAIGGMRGCSHVLTLAHLVGSTVPWAVAADRSRHGTAPVRATGERVFRRDIVLDGTEGGDGTVGLSVQLSDLLWTPAPPITSPMQRFGAHHEIRLDLSVDVKTFSLAAIAGAQRRRTTDNLTTAPWEDLGPLVHDLVGMSVLHGVSAQLRQRFAPHATERPLLDALLMVAPTLIQCAAARSEAWAALTKNTTSLVGMGGIPDSCYMWRRDGALHQSRRTDDPVPRS